MKKPNVILITIDSLRADHLGFMGYKKNISPNLDAFSKKSVVFSNAYSQAPVTLHSFPSLLTSTYPLDFYGPKKMQGRVLISEVFKNNGYETAAFHSNAYLSDYFGYNKGWDYFEANIIPEQVLIFEPQKDKGVLGSIKKVLKKLLVYFSAHPYFLAKFIKYKKDGLKDKIPYTKADFLIEIVKDFIAAKQGSDKPFFLWVHFMDVHAPYFPLDSYKKQRPLNYKEFVAKEFWGPWKTFGKKKFFRNLIQKSLLPKIISLYDDGIQYMDEYFGKFYKFLEEKGIAENSIIALTADHGDEFFEHNDIGHQCKLYDELLHVPLLIKSKETGSKIIDEPVGTIDLMPTLCSLAGIEKPKEFKGKSLFENSGEAVFHETVIEPKDVEAQENINASKVALHFWDYKYIFDFKAGKAELYNIKKDPSEQCNIIAANPDLAANFKRELDRFILKNPLLPLKY